MVQANISKNGDLLRLVSDWFDKHLKKAITDFDDTKLDRDRMINREERESTKTTLKYQTQQLINTGKITVSGIFKYLTKLANIGLIDNAVLRKMEKAYSNLKQNDKKFIGWIRKHPSISSYISYYVIAAALSLATFGVTRSNNNINDKDNNKVGQKKEVIVKSPVKTNPENTYVVQENSKFYDISDTNFVQQFVDDNWNDMVVCLLQFETFFKKPTKQASIPRLLYGPGLTWVYETKPDGKIIQHPCVDEWAKRAAKFSMAEILDQVKIHVQYRNEVLPLIQKSLLKNKIKTATTEQILALFITAYQMPANSTNVIKKISETKQTQKQIDAFQYYNGKSEFRNGTLKRRWWCAALYTGKITIDDLYTLPIDVFSNSNLDILLKGNHFDMSPDVIEYCLNLTNSNKNAEQFLISHHIKTKPTIVADADIAQKTLNKKTVAQTPMPKATKNKSAEFAKAKNIVVRNGFFKTLKRGKQNA